MNHQCGKLCSKNKCGNNSSNPTPGTALFFTDAVSDVPPITSPTQTIGVNGLLRFTSQSLNITTSSGGGGVGVRVGSTVLNIEAPSEFIGPVGPVGPQGPPGLIGDGGSVGPSISGQQGTIVTWYSGSATAGPVPTQIGPEGAPYLGFLSTGFPIQAVLDVNPPVITDSGAPILLTPKNSSGVATSFQLTLQNVVGSSDGGVPSQLVISVYLYEYDSNLLTYNIGPLLGQLNAPVPFGLSNILYFAIDVAPIFINPGDIVAAIVSDGNASNLVPTITIGRYFAQLV